MMSYWTQSLVMSWGASPSMGTDDDEGEEEEKSNDDDKEEDLLSFVDNTELEMYDCGWSLLCRGTAERMGR